MTLRVTCIDEEEYTTSLSCRYEESYGNNNDENKTKMDADMDDSGEN